MQNRILLSLMLLLFPLRLHSVIGVPLLFFISIFSMALPGSPRIRQLTLMCAVYLDRSTGSTDGTDSSASFNQPFGIGLDLSGNIYVADTANNKIRKIVCQ